MKNLLVFGVCCILLVACSKEIETVDDSINDKPVITGEIIELQDGRFLVESVSPATDESGQEMVWFSTEEIESLKVGLIVSVWADAVDQSYPAQADADKIVIRE